MAQGDISYAEVVGTLLTGSLATLYTVPSGKAVLAYNINLLNVDSAVTYYPEIQAIPSGQSAGARYQRHMPQAAGGNGLLPGESRPYVGNPMWAAGEFIQAREAGGTANKIAFSMGLTLVEV